MATMPKADLSTVQKHHLFLGNLHYDATTSDIHQLFSSFSITLSEVRIINNFPARFAFVRLEDENDLSRAFEFASGKAIRGRCLRICLARTKAEVTPPITPQHKPAFGVDSPPELTFETSPSDFDVEVVGKPAPTPKQPLPSSPKTPTKAIDFAIVQRQHVWALPLELYNFTPMRNNGSFRSSPSDPIAATTTRNDTVANKHNDTTTTLMADKHDTRIYIQGLPYMQDDLVARHFIHGLFAAFCVKHIELGRAPASARLLGRNDCYAWLTLSSPAEAAAAVAKLHGVEFDWGRLFVLIPKA